LKDDQVQLIINTPLGQKARFDKGTIGKVALEKMVLVITTLSGAQAAVRAIRTGQRMEVKPLQDYHRSVFGS
jgi:carbamoyl-phosphate synthase large subunit